MAGVTRPTAGLQPMDIGAVVLDMATVTGMLVVGMMSAIAEWVKSNAVTMAFAKGCKSLVVGIMGIVATGVTAVFCTFDVLGNILGNVEGVVTNAVTSHAPSLAVEFTSTWYGMLGTFVALSDSFTRTIATNPIGAALSWRPLAWPATLTLAVANLMCRAFLSSAEYICAALYALPLPSLALLVAAGTFVVRMKGGLEKEEGKRIGAKKFDQPALANAKSSAESLAVKEGRWRAEAEEMASAAVGGGVSSSSVGGIVQEMRSEDTKSGGATRTVADTSDTFPSPVARSAVASPSEAKVGETDRLAANRDEEQPNQWQDYPSLKKLTWERSPSKEAEGEYTPADLAEAPPPSSIPGEASMATVVEERGDLTALRQESETAGQGMVKNDQTEEPSKPSREAPLPQAGETGKGTSDGEDVDVPYSASWSDIRQAALEAGQAVVPRVPIAFGITMGQIFKGSLAFVFSASETCMDSFQQLRRQRAEDGGVQEVDEDEAEQTSQDQSAIVDKGS